MDEYAISVSAYIQKCTEDVCVTKHISSGANEKPWMSEVLERLKALNAAFKSNDEVVLRTARAHCHDQAWLLLLFGL